MNGIRSVLKTHPKQVAPLIRRSDETLFVPVPLGRARYTAPRSGVRAQR